jgi:hypothetical protein
MFAAAPTLAGELSSLVLSAAGPENSPDVAGCALAALGVFAQYAGAESADALAGCVLEMLGELEDERLVGAFYAISSALWVLGEAFAHRVDDGVCSLLVDMVESGVLADYRDASNLVLIGLSSLIRSGRTQLIDPALIITEIILTHRRTSSADDEYTAGNFFEVEMPIDTIDSIAMFTDILRETNAWAHLDPDTRTMLSPVLLQDGVSEPDDQRR